ncbi:MAG: glycerate kinase [Clostridia bacterium]|nr:glycerate kinase [Clostridia bacterium]
MKVVIAIDSFKGSLTSLEAGKAVENAILKVDNGAKVTVCPIADGGEGTVDAMKAGLNGEIIETFVTGPLGEKVKAKYCVIKGKTAVIEMAEASGLTLVPEKLRSPLQTTTYGVGELIKNAISRGCKSFIIGIGGSATNDGGVGMLSALGFKFLDKDKNAIPFGAKGLKVLDSISVESVIPELKNCTFKVACDVNNPLCGKNGCSAIYGPQKGATEKDVELMDGWLLSYAEIVKTVFPSANPEYPGAGAAGGLGFAFKTFLNAELQSGINIILEEIELEKHIINADIVVTGEGRLDSQSVMGKAPIGVASLAKKHGKKVVAFAGCVSTDAEVCNAHGIDAFFPIVRGVTTLEEALDKTNALNNLTATAYQVFRLIKTK